MTLGKLLQTDKDAIVRRWLEDALASYSEEAAVAFGRQKDPFSNPVGHSLRVGTGLIVEELFNGMDAEKIYQSLHEIIKIRAVQQMTASQAVGFIFLLKDAVRAELGDAVSEPRLATELVELEKRIDSIALAAFDVFVKHREHLSELRINEVKRRISWVVEKMNQRDLEPAMDQINLG